MGQTKYCGKCGSRNYAGKGKKLMDEFVNIHLNTVCAEEMSWFGGSVIQQQQCGANDCAFGCGLCRGLLRSLGPG